MRIMRKFYTPARITIAFAVATTCLFVIHNSLSIILYSDGQSNDLSANQNWVISNVNVKVRRDVIAPSAGDDDESNQDGQGQLTNHDAAELNDGVQVHFSRDQIPPPQFESAQHPEAQSSTKFLQMKGQISTRFKQRTPDKLLTPVLHNMKQFTETGSSIQTQTNPNQQLPNANLEGSQVKPLANDKECNNRSKATVNYSYPQLIDNPFIAAQRIVHFDLKGAPPKVEYFKQVFALISQKLGATGVLIEWEDMFPYTGRLEKTNNGYHYSEQEINTILGWAKDYGLEVIPLVQTLGHMEWILKHLEFNFREVERYPQVLCLSNSGSIELVKEMIDQVMRLHKNIRYFHIGSDEAFQIGKCPVCQRNLRENLNDSRAALMLRHISSVASYIRNNYQLKVLMWHDMLQNIDVQLLRAYNIGHLIEPVVWAYEENLGNYLSAAMWKKFASVFPYIWGASAFKGADGPTRWWSNVPHYLKNHQSWLRQMTSYHQLFTEFRGMFLTGWQRFDHFAVLCELFPVGIPSLAVSLLTLKKGSFDRNTLQHAATALQCKQQYLEIDSQGIAANCKFPGANIYEYVQLLRLVKTTMEIKMLQDYQLKFALKHNYSSAWYLDLLFTKLTPYKNDYETLKDKLHSSLSEMFFPDAADEFIFTYVQDDLDRLRTLMENARRLGAITHFQARPFTIQLDHNSTTMELAPAKPVLPDLPVFVPRTVAVGDGPVDLNSDSSTKPVNATISVV